MKTIRGAGKFQLDTARRRGCRKWCVTMLNEVRSFPYTYQRGASEQSFHKVVAKRDRYLAVIPRECEWRVRAHRPARFFKSDSCARSKRIDLCPFAFSRGFHASR